MCNLVIQLQTLFFTSIIVYNYSVVASIDNFFEDVNQIGMLTKYLVANQFIKINISIFLLFIWNLFESQFYSYI